MKSVFRSHTRTPSVLSTSTRKSSTPSYPGAKATATAKPKSVSKHAHSEAFFSELQAERESSKEAFDMRFKKKEMEFDVKKAQLAIKLAEQQRLTDRERYAAEDRARQMEYQREKEAREHEYQMFTARAQQAGHQLPMDMSQRFLTQSYRSMDSSTYDNAQLGNDLSLDSGAQYSTGMSNF